MSDLKRGRILLVDDDTEVLTPLRDFLTELGYEVAAYVSAKEALEALRAKEFDLLLTDLIMPEMNGIDLLKAAFEIDPLLVGIVITGKGTVETAVEVMKIGAFDYLMKPLEWKMLKPIISRALEVRFLRIKEKKYRSIVEDQVELICRFLPDGTVTYVNEVSCRYFGKRPEEIMGHSFMPFIPEEDQEFVREQISSLDKDNSVITIEHRVIAHNGEIRWQQWTNRALFDEQGRITEYQSVGHDITDRKETEEKLKSSYEQLRSLAARLTEVEEAEKQALARELHDQIGQNLTVLGINLNIVKSLSGNTMNDTVLSRLDDSLALLDQTSEQIRDVMSNLRPSVIDDYGLLAGLRWYGGHFSKRTGISVEVKGDEPVPRLTQVIETTLFRIAQEALNNIARHARANRVTITLQDIEGMEQLTINDNGIGFDPDIPRQSIEQPKWGIITMRERAQAIGGNLQVKTSQGDGTTVIVEVKK
jgi:PAS domain S-box-containing protein